MSKRLLERLFAERWCPFHEFMDRREELDSPGVYVLAYSGRDLDGRTVQADEVFYVGMSRAVGGLRSRLKQFQSGIENGKSHSAAGRFFRDHSRSRGYTKLRSNKKLFAAALCIPCEVKKDRRTAKDLRLMGQVARLEYEVLAHIKELTGKEPELNKQ
ncbi:MAG: hypothetical protein OXH94_17380 [Rhodospirillales bacterium]|nr:hypothetical protein [Rhodospirillales bacterium]